MKKESLKLAKNDILKNPTKDKIKEERLLQDIHKAVFQEFNDSWRGHVPVYGWIQMNYPKTLKPSLLYKIKNAEISKKEENEISNKEADDNKDFKESSLHKNSSKKIMSVDSKAFEKNYLEDLTRRKFKHPDRIFPDKANDHVIKESII